jgi:hypothetical protein
LTTQGLQPSLGQQFSTAAILHEDTPAALFGVNDGPFGLLGELDESFVAVALEEGEEVLEVKWGVGGGG